MSGIPPAPIVDERPFDRAARFAYDPKMIPLAPRLFPDDAAITRIGKALLNRTLPRPEWTHEAHLAACVWIVRDRPDLKPEQDLPGIIRTYNEAVGGVNSDTEGYHETITQLFIAAVRAHLAEMPVGTPLVTTVNRLLTSPRGQRDWPLRYYSRERLFSVAARRGFIAPDLNPAPDPAFIRADGSPPGLPDPFPGADRYD